MWKVKMGDVHHAPKAKVAATIAVANANSNANSTNPLMKKPKDRVPVKVSLMEINQYLMCQLCSGYLVDATAIIECQHTFCKSCILKYLETNSYCPICDVQLNKAKPHLSLRADAILQKLVYKTVPGLFVSEIRRRKDFARKFPSDSPAGTLVELDEAEDLCVLSPDDAVSLSLEYFKSDEDSNEQKQPQQQSQQQQKQQTLQSQKKSTCSDKANDRRYLQCPAAVSVGLLKKFIRMKYGLLDDYRVDLLYNGDRDSNLENDLTLLDLAFIFKWNKDEPMCFHYRIFDRPVKSVSPRPGTKRPAPSMMDEPPPDDDAASGPPNRSSMASASPSKLPRISESGTNSNNTSNNTSTNNSNNSSSSATHSSASPSSSSLASPETVTTPSASSSATPVAAVSDSPKKTTKGHNSHKSNHKSSKGKGHHAPADEIPSSTMSRRSMSANANANATNSPNTRGRVNSTSKKEQQEESKSKSSANASVTTGSKLHKTPSVTTKLNNGSLKLSISNANMNVSPPRSVSPPRERLKISLGSIAKEKSSHNHHSHEKRHHHHHRRHKLKKEKNREKKEKKRDRDKDKSKHSNKIKLSLNLNNLTASSCSSNSSNSNSHNSSSSSSNNSSNNHSNQSQNHSQQFCSVKDGKQQQTSNANEKDGKGKSGQSSNGSSSSNSGNRATSSSHAQIGVTANVNTSNGSQSNVNQSQNQGGKIKALPNTNTGLISKNSGLDIQPANNSSSASSSFPRTSGNNHHPLLPDSVQVPKSVTLIPVNPNAPNSSKTTNNSSRGDKSSNRLNSHTFTHPITNKSLHQITVTEVPPPQQKTNSSANSSGTNGNSSAASVTSSSAASQSTGGSSSSLEKAIVSATTGSNANKPQFSGPGSMEITKIYSSTAGFDSATAKKLKERKGLDISISGTSLSVVKPTGNSREENYRQNISSGGIGQQSNSVANTNKAKSAAAALLSGKMPPGITIGPANAMGSSNSRQNDPSKGGLTFTIPHHMGNTTIPGNLPALRNIGTKVSEKSGKKDNSNSGNGKPVRTPPPPPLPTNTIQAPQTQQQPQRKLGENLSFDMRASPSPPKEKNSSAKEQTSSATPGNNSKGFKRSFDAGSLNRKNHLSLASTTAQSQRESPGPERKRDRSNSNSGSRSSSSSASAAADHDSPLDLSGKSSRSEHSTASKSDISFPKGANRPPTPVPMSLSPLQSSATGKSSKESTSYHQTNKNTSSSATKPLNQISNTAQQTPTILSIAQSLHQKQQQQQQQTQFLQHQLALGLGQQQQQSNQKNSSSSSARTSPHIANSLGNQSNSMNSNNSGSSSNISASSLDSLSSQMIPMSSPSPPNTTGFNSLRMLADATLLHKMHPMNSLMAVAGMCSQGVPPLSLSNAAASVSNQLSPGLFGQTPSGTMNPGKPMGPPHGLLDPSHHNIFAALQNQSLNNGRVGVGGMVGNPFGTSLSPPLYYPGNPVRPPTQLQPPTVPSLRIPTVTPKLSSGGKSPSSLNSPISMTPPHLYPSLSQNSNLNSKPKSASPSPPSGSPSNSSSIMSSVLNSNTSARPSSHNSMSNSFNQTQSGIQRSQKINGIHSSVPIIPPGVHNPLLPSRISSSSTSSGHNYLSAALASTASKASSMANSNINKSVPSNSSSNSSQSSAAKSGIPASMKISNFLPPPSKASNTSPYNANAQATITSSSGISSSLYRFLNSLPPLLSPSQQQHVPQHSLSLLPPFSVPSTKSENAVPANKVLPTETNLKSGKSHSSMKSGFGTSSDSRKDTKGKYETIGISSPTSSLSALQDKAKITSGATSTSSATGFGAPLNLNLSLGLGSPPPSSRTTQPQSQAVRHIPNPCLLFNRQNSGGNNNNVNINVSSPSSSAPTMTLNSVIPPINNDSQHDSTNTNTTADGKKSPLVRVPMPMPPTILPSQTMPLQAQVATHSMLSLFPGVSVPLKVEVPIEEEKRCEGKEELPLRSSSPPSPVVPPVKKAKVEITERSSPVTLSMPIVIPTVPLQSPVKQPLPVLLPSTEKTIKEETLVGTPSQFETKTQENVTEKITENENQSTKENIEMIQKVVEHDNNVNHKVEMNSLPLIIDKKEDLEGKGENQDIEEVQLVREDSSSVQVDNEDVDIVDVESVDVVEEENETTGKLAVIVGENEVADKKTTDVAVNILDSEVSNPGEEEVKMLADVKELTENSPNKIVSEIEKEREGCLDEEEKIPVILTGTDSKEIVTGDKLTEISEPKLELHVDTVDEVKTDIINEMGNKCEEQESASESAMEIDVVGDDGEIELDVGVDEPMEVPLQGILQSLKSDENSESVLGNDNEMHSEETSTVIPDFIQSSSQVINTCSSSDTDTAINSSTSEKDITEEKQNLPGEPDFSEGSPEKKMKFSEEILKGENEKLPCEVLEEREDEEMEVDVDVDVCDEGSETKINSEDNSGIITKEFPADVVLPVEKVCAVVTVLPCAMKTEEIEPKVNTPEVVASTLPDSVLCASTEENETAIENEDIQCKIEMEDSSPEKVDKPVDSVDNEIAAGAVVEECNPELLESSNSNASIQNEIGESIEGSLEATTETKKVEELNTAEASAEKIASIDVELEVPLEGKTELNGTLPAEDCVSNEDDLKSNCCEDKPEEDLVVNKSQNIIQMSERSLPEETPTVFPSDINSAPATCNSDPITIATVSLPTETGEVAIKVEEEPEPVARIQSPGVEEVPSQQQLQNTIPHSQPNCFHQIETSVHTDTPVSIAIPSEEGLIPDQIKSNNSETETESTRALALSVSSPNSEAEADGSSSSLSSPSSLVGIVGVGVQRVNLKKMENLEKVAAGLLATANMNMGTININNNNNSLSPANCDITITTANQC